MSLHCGYLELCSAGGSGSQCGAYIKAVPLGEGGVISVATGRECSPRTLISSLLDRAKWL